LREESNYYLATKYDKDAIFDKDGNRISEWYDRIWEDGLVKGESDYYLVKELVNDDYEQYAIFDKDGNRITKEWYDWISVEGLVKGKSPYYLARKNGKDAIFDKDGHMITPQCFDDIEIDGLVKGQSKYYKVYENGKYTIFDIDGNQILDWSDEIYSDGLLRGLTDYFIACNGNTCAVYHKDGKKVSEDFSREKIEDVYKINFNDRLGIVEIQKYDKTTQAIEFNPVRREEFLDYTKLLNI
jgi:hypothetical protein